MNIMKMVEAKDLLDFSQAFSVTRDYLGDKIFPDMKTQNMRAEFYRLSDQRMLPTMAMVHALDTEAHIGQRPTMEKVELEKMLIKEKINQSERVQMWLENGADTNSIVRYIFDDVARLSESVKTRTEVMKCEALCTGKLTIKENNANFNVDYKVPAGNRISLTWNDTKADILGDIQDMLDKAKLSGQTIRQVITSTKVLAALRKNEGIQTAIYSALGKGTYVSNTMLASLLNDMFGITITAYDEYYRYEDKKGDLVSRRYFDENNGDCSDAGRHVRPRPVGRNAGGTRAGCLDGQERDAVHYLRHVGGTGSGSRLDESIRHVHPGHPESAGLVYRHGYACVKE